MEPVCAKLIDTVRTFAQGCQTECHERLVLFPVLFYRDEMNLYMYTCLVRVRYCIAFSNITFKLVLRSDAEMNMA